MKRFVYFEQQDGGMDVHHITDIAELRYLYGWMSDSCKTEDTAMLTWADSAEIGEMFDHRLGCLVRLKDK